MRALESDYRCVRFTLPGFDGPVVGPAPTLADITARLLAVVDQAAGFEAQVRSWLIESDRLPPACGV